MSEVPLQGSGFSVHASGFMLQGSGFRVQGSRFRVRGFDHEDPGYLVFSDDSVDRQPLCPPLSNRFVPERSKFVQGCFMFVPQTRVYDRLVSPFEGFGVQGFGLP